MAEAAGLFLGGKILTILFPPVVRLIKRAKLYPNDDQISKDILIILAELETMDDEAKEEVRDRLEQIETWLKDVFAQQAEWRKDTGFCAKFSKSRRHDMKEAGRLAITMKEAAISVSAQARAARACGSKKPKKQTSYGSSSLSQIPFNDILDIAEYYGCDLTEAVQIYGRLARGCAERGLPRKSDTTQTPPAASTEPSAEPLQTSATSPPTVGSDSSPQATADDAESILDNMSDCISFVSAISALPDSAFLDVDISLDAMQASMASLGLQ